MSIPRTPPKKLQSTSGPQTRAQSKSHSRSQSRSRSESAEPADPSTSTRENTPAGGTERNPPNNIFVQSPPSHLLLNQPPADKHFTKNVTKRSRQRTQTEELSDHDAEQTVIMSQLDPTAEKLKELGTKHDNVHKFIEDVDHLKLDGSNISRWKLRTSRAVFDMTGIQDYWNSKRPDENSPVQMQIDRCAG
ncbi:uncharacterized protein MELLADRAFT_71397 [Melampsora larici-populina 98AG31]|uniref:Uncharacterized protein n=1 Tax=Melampsora larici-populina (strain 98AG31 / pathotype 3-4-7) TaxID=747676 RepID=F4RGB7_MELLP|nr:uncharacterized protein MELLADRAFT_71397 [Melampsora larici-populina 98AG31]EGG08692.1 hypothetical protein MELLADRAFT_71397 [Melampsora larici-populina 98AG31]